MRNLTLTIALFWSVFALAAQPAPAPVKKSLTTLEQGMKAYNLVQSVSKLYLAMKIGGRADDEDYFQKMADATTKDFLPKATVKNGEIWLQGLPKPIKVIAINDGVFSYNGHNFDLSMKDGAEATFDAIKAIVYPKSDVASWLLPEANADTNFTDMLAGIAGVGGFAMAANSCGDQSQAVGCGVGGLLGGFGLGYLITSLIDKNNAPSQMTCYPGQNGCSQVVLMGVNRVPVNTIAQCPGQPISYSPALGQVGLFQTQTMASNLVSMCSYPGTMSMMNAAYAVRVPSMYTTTTQTAQLLPLSTPGVPLVNGRPPVVLPAAKPASSRAPAAAAATANEPFEAGR